ncbi:hypothetical protein SAMN05428953_12678 [Mesorhizobium muleiense]|uniref:Uncharacterized protein n=1 Tax=Mesorhizobium muleiense TaxID=1004279 RepID=A0A1G9H5Q4_9HYPH|nr:hypothetical protein [Mesorhizobium muleiense]SDL08318.1 hypothetical protein SAMN05428953_12678 [Mesorhizobium muleiense]
MRATPKFRTPYGMTGADIAAALSMKPRAKQAVTLISKRHGGGLPARILVLVEGEYYEVLERTFDELNRGVTPAELELEPYNPADDFNDDFEG